MPTEMQLSDVLSDFARTMVTDFPIQGILDHLVERIVDVLPVSGAGVTLISDNTDPRYVAASDDSALLFERLQSELGEGPCLLAYNTDDAVTVPDLRSETRFPIFTPQALAAGLAAVFTFPLRHGDRQLGALDLYRDTPGAISPEAMAAAQTLADVVAAYLINAQARTELRDGPTRPIDARDPLTGLPDRAFVVDRLGHALDRRRGSSSTCTVFVIDPDGLAAINAGYGRDVGDELMVAVAVRLADLLRPEDTIARLAGDEFVVVCEELETPEHARAVGARIETALARPVVLPGLSIELTASIGIAFIGGTTSGSAEQLLHDADAAMNQAKRRAGASLEMFAQPRLHVADLPAHVGRQLFDAVRQGELHTEYQPIVSTQDGRISGFEAVVRWVRHPSRGLMSPATLARLAEQAGLSSDIGRWTLHRACRDRQTWPRERGRDHLAMSVNVSPSQLLSDDFASTVAAVLDQTGTDPRLLTLELSKTIFVRDDRRALAIIGELKEIGVQLALDEWTTTYSSISSIKRSPIDVIKINRTLVAGLGEDSSSHVIIAAVVQLAHSLGMFVIAQGVTTPEQYEAASSLGCDQAQGDYFARPMTADGVTSLLRYHGEGSVLTLPLASGRGNRAARAV